MKDWNQNMQKFEEIEYHYDKLKVLWLNYWKEEVVFTYQWWIMILILILPFFLWWMLVDKRRIIEISLVGLFISGIAFILDQLVYHCATGFIPIP